MYIAYDKDSKRIIDESKNELMLKRKYLAFYQDVRIVEKSKVKIEKRFFKSLEFEYVV